MLSDPILVIKKLVTLGMIQVQLGVLKSPETAETLELIIDLLLFGGNHFVVSLLSSGVDSLSTKIGPDFSSTICVKTSLLSGKEGGTGAMLRTPNRKNSMKIRFVQYIV